MTISETGGLNISSIGILILSLYSTLRHRQKLSRTTEEHSILIFEKVNLVGVANAMLSLKELKNHLLKVCTDIMGTVSDLPVPFCSRDAEFIFGGYSWREREFCVWTFYYEDFKSVSNPIFPEALNILFIV